MANISSFSCAGGATGGFWRHLLTGCCGFCCWLTICGGTGEVMYLSLSLLGASGRKESSFVACGMFWLLIVVVVVIGFFGCWIGLLSSYVLL